MRCRGGAFGGNVGSSNDGGVRVWSCHQTLCCGSGRMRLIATMAEPRVIRRILAYVGLPTENSDPSPVQPSPGRTADIFPDIPASPVLAGGSARP
jgi:hypothetical protein